MLAASCGACEAMICNVAPSCCSNAWDQGCVSYVAGYCGTVCQ
jgi:hypothetical protein